MMPFNALKKMAELGYSGRYMNTQIKMSLCVPVKHIQMKKGAH